MKRLVFIGVVVLLTLGDAFSRPAFAQAPFTAVKACVAKDAGITRLVQSAAECRNNETFLDWFRWGTLYAADGTMIGPLLSSSTVATVIAGTPYAVYVTRTGWANTGGPGAFFYFDSNCSDGPYVMLSGLPTGQPAPVGDGNRYFLRYLTLVEGTTQAWTAGGTVRKQNPYSGTPNMWVKYTSMSTPCTPTMMDWGPSYEIWFEDIVFVDLPQYPAPFSVR